MTDKTPKQRDIHTMSQNKSKAWWDRVFAKAELKPDYDFTELLKKAEEETK